ncbi:MAG: universal stress protein [Bacteroidota bacterium]|uniref:Universal stress protein n=1 Tax=Flagellimonas profundi TaxID=2915620 RepID=A0ABS3FBB2_9FLAO|nr:universal stress protein [Allomuricauda profundi]MBO0340439.1 universal stress protein [Allomuricauda profundi]MEC7770265.1 universal stress protein [Bacteroidota bacterium]
MKNILVPTDFSENSIRALKYAQVLFSAMECNFYLLYVGTLLDTKKDSESFQEVENESSENTKKKLNDLVKNSRKHSTEANHFFFALHEYGFFIPTIKKHVEEQNIHLIVMGTKGVSGIKEKVLGSNAGDVITKVQCNTLVVPVGVELSKPKEIAFPTDFNIFYSLKILRPMEEMVTLGKAKFSVMNALKEGDSLNEEQEKNKEHLLDFMQDSFQGTYSFHTITNQKVKSAIQCFVESRDIDMIVMVAKNLNFIQQILFDSIVEQISFHTKIPFYVIHE